MRSLPEHPFYAGATLEWDGDTMFKVRKLNRCVRVEKLNGDWELALESDRYKMRATLHGGLVDEAILWINESARNGGPEKAEATNDSMRADLPSTPDGLVIAATKVLRECSPGVLRDLCRELDDYNMRTKEWKV